jgi:hypothetical protein
MHAAFPRVIAWTSFIQQREVEMRERGMDDPLVLYGNRFSSRLLLGTARYESPRQLTDAIGVADPAMLDRVPATPALGIEGIRAIFLGFTSGDGSRDSPEHRWLS